MNDLRWPTSRLRAYCNNSIRLSQTISLCVCVDDFDWTSTCTTRRKQAAGNELEIESQTFCSSCSVEEAKFLNLLMYLSK